ncbi:hypothetical protein BHYA_0091g00280 [Botrytis hyacinthi]|uniref:RING-type domain-containing protein n=1 Tax=Botrytis hyacinthi TaxID=278943 RepID=A0A4Z1GLC4_9HELO|nr:hypothetical protein BHYA_0091g00280 [Botrytis hyacinthi]
MAHRSRVPDIIDLLRQNGRDDLELRFRRDLQTYGPEIRAGFHGLLTLDRQNELLKRFVFSRTFLHGSRFPGDMALDDLPMLADPADGGHPPRSRYDDFTVLGIPHLSLFATAFHEMDARERRLRQIAMQAVPTTSQPHIYDNRLRADGRSLEAATLRSAILPPKTDDSRDDGSRDDDSRDNDCEDTHDHNDGQDVDRQDNDDPPVEILGANSALEDDDICPICREGYSDAQPSTSLIPNCGHFFHMGCMVRWISSDPIVGQLRDRCICCRRKYTGLLSQFYGEVTPPQNGEDFWRNDNGPLINEVFPRLEILSSRYSSDETQLLQSTINESILYGITYA